MLPLFGGAWAHLCFCHFFAAQLKRAACILKVVRAMLALIRRALEDPDVCFIVLGTEVRRKRGCAAND